jgi:hypothetical protein
MHGDRKKIDTATLSALMLETNRKLKDFGHSNVIKR